jgi:16S rRNA (guanine527-N7)-methyltransferase
VDAHLSHASGFLAAWTGPPPATALDLGAGGGVPAFPLALAWSESRWALVEASGRRARFLGDAVLRLGLSARVEVWEGRAEELGRDASRRLTRDLVTARSFARPAVTAECAAPFLAVGGRLLVSEPPEERAWPPESLAELGLRPLGRAGSVMVLEQSETCPDRFPRRRPEAHALF